MKSPITGKEMSLQKKEEIITFRKEEFNYLHFNYLCEDSGENFSTTELDELNINQVYNQYRDKHNLPFLDEIKYFREKLDIPASKMSQILGFGANSFRNYEKGEVPSLANGNLIKLVINDVNQFKNLVKSNDEISLDEKEKIFLKIDNLLEEEKRSYSDAEFVKNLFNHNLLPDNFSGYIKPNMNKLSEMIVYFTEKLKPSKTMMNKLLFYSDFLNFKKCGFSISGTRYVAIQYGPVPDRYYGIFDYLTHKDFVKIVSEEYGYGYVGETFYPTKKSFDFDLFTEIELESIKHVFNKFKSLKATQIMEMSHEEEAWLENKDSKNLIDYNYSFELKNI
ncbi:type II toxin-antitoxin system antitoxin SocA domain-containing protein [Gillisia sp. JM1]|uniref:type II toxin-antitoxin system antitoxin SocA domain-containing protein n=1 Tax=Gillisia sp. JM1 TaxID=1283286 RepID=UPI00041EB8F4|nr:type II toxin-antitoxin system antitoxin SocA domain-containing protein [Gillisia sp. JM1]